MGTRCARHCQPVSLGQGRRPLPLEKVSMARELNTGTSDLQKWLFEVPFWEVILDLLHTQAA